MRLEEGQLLKNYSVDPELTKQEQRNYEDSGAVTSLQITPAETV